MSTGCVRGPNASGCCALFIEYIIIDLWMARGDLSGARKVRNETGVREVSINDNGEVRREDFRMLSGACGAKKFIEM